MQIADALREETLDLVDHLTGLDDDRWDSPSLCTEWRVRDVLAHVVAGAEGAFGPRAIVAGMVRHGFSFNRWIAADGRTRGQQDPTVSLRALRDTATDPGTSPERRPIRALMHVLIHGQDICRPLGITRVLPETRLIPVADFVSDDVRIFRANKRIAGLRLVATDMHWSRGNGPEVTGPAESLVMMMAGRSVALDDLSGDGKAVLVSRR